MSVEVHGYAIVSADDCIADAAGVLPAALHNGADWAYFQAELDRADWVILGRASHEAAPNVRRRRRIVVSRSSLGLEARADGLWWRPDKVSFAEVLARTLPGGGRVAVPGGQGAFELFLDIGYAAFHLARAEAVRLPGGRAMFARGAAEETLNRAGLAVGRKTWLDEPARVSLTIYAR